jgi:hypothetical protein
MWSPFPFRFFPVCGLHLRHQFFQGGGRIPVQLFAGFGGVAQQDFPLRRAEIARVDAHHGGAGVGAKAGLVEAFALPFDSIPNQLGGC